MIHNRPTTQINGARRLGRNLGITAADGTHVIDSAIEANEEQRRIVEDEERRTRIMRDFNNRAFDVIFGIACGKERLP